MRRTHVHLTLLALSTAAGALAAVLVLAATVRETRALAARHADALVAAKRVRALDDAAVQRARDHAVGGDRAALDAARWEEASVDAALEGLRAVADAGTGARVADLVARRRAAMGAATATGFDQAVRPARHALRAALESFVERSHADFEAASAGLAGRADAMTWLAVLASLAALAVSLVFGRLLMRASARDHEAQLRALLDSAPDAMVIVGAGGRIAHVNAQAEAMFGWPADALRGRSVEALLPEEAREIHGRHRAAYLAEPRTRSMGAARDLRALRRDGSTFPVEVSLAPLRDGVVASAIRDVTAAREVERRLRASLREKDVLLKEVHHRVKNNLQVIASLLNLQARRVADEASRGAIIESRNRVRSIALYHEKLYRSADLAAVAAVPYRREIVTNAVRSSAVDDAIAVEVEGDDLSLDPDAAIPCGLIANELVTNAMKHAFPDGRGRIRVEIRRLADDRARLTVADDGVGLPADIEARSTRSLGLELVRTLVDQVGGALTWGDAGPGARFEVALRVPAREQEAAAWPG